MTVPKLKELLELLCGTKAKGLKPELQEKALAAAQKERERLSRSNDGKSTS